MSTRTPGVARFLYGPPSAQVRALQFYVSSYVDRYRGSGHCALRAPTVFSVRMKSTSVQKTRLLLTTRTGGFT
ncbi:MAG: hypothetical protein WC830_21080, partial [Burkholderiales bacterium]